MIYDFYKKYFLGKNTFFHRGGVTMVMAVITISVLLTMSLTTSALILGEIEFAGYSRESQKAFFASDAGAECAIYWDLKEGAFATMTPPANITCGTFINRQPTENTNDIYRFAAGFSNGACVAVEIDKAAVPGTAIVRSRGYNVGTANFGTMACDSTDPRRVERALRVTY